MKLGRIEVAAFGRNVARLVAVFPEQHHIIDLALAEYHRLRRRGATDEAAHRIASGLFPESMSAAMGAGPFFMEAVQQCVETCTSEAVFDIDEVSWLAPIDPPMFRDCLAFEKHLENAFVKGRNTPIPSVYYELPIYYKGNRLTIIGHEHIVPYPDYTDYLDYELELAFIIGRDGTDLRPEEAHSSVFGVTILNDFSARDMQRRESAGLLGPAKGKDFCTALGPWITTSDELPDTPLTMVARVNGEEWSRGTSADLLWSVEEIVAYISKTEGVHIGDVIGSGTIGFGSGIELGRRLQPSDVVELEIEAIGILRNRIATPQQPGWMPTHRTRF